MIRGATFFLLLFTLCAQAPKLRVGGDYAAQFQRWLSAEAETHFARRDRDIAALDSRDAIRARQEYIRRTALELIGGLPTEKTPLNARVTSTFTRPGYRVENVIFESLPGFRVTANLYLPTTGAAPYPAVLGVAGHSNNGKASATYQTAFIGFAKRGIAVLAYDPPGQGERLEFYDSQTSKSRAGIGVNEHFMAGVPALLTGSHLARYLIWDGVRAIDYLLTRPDIDPRRLAVAGNSGGGTQAGYLAMLEPRLATAISSCYMTSWRELWSGPGPQDAEQVWPAFIAKGLDFGDFALAQAPRPFLMTTAIRDYFPIAGARATFRATQRLFDLNGGGEKLGYFEFDDTHGWSRPRREAANRWLEKFFFQRESDGHEGETHTEEESQLYATPTGQLATSGGSETVQSLTRRQAADLAAHRPAATPDTIRKAVGWRDPPIPTATSRGTVDRPNYRIEKLELTVEGGVHIPALHYLPKTVKGHWVYAAPSGTSGDPDIEELIGLGYAVLAIDPRGSGEGYTASGASQSYQTAARAWLLDRNLLEMQAADLVAALRYLHAEHVGLMAKGNLGPAAMLAMAMEPAFERLLLENSIVSYQAVVDATLHENLSNTIVPGLLKHFDLPDLLAHITPRRVITLTPVTPNGVPLRGKALPPNAIPRGEAWPLVRYLN